MARLFRAATLARRFAAPRQFKNERRKRATVCRFATFERKEWRCYTSQETSTSKKPSEMTLRGIKGQATRSEEAGAAARRGPPQTPPIAPRAQPLARAPQHGDATPRPHLRGPASPSGRCQVAAPALRRSSSALQHLPPTQPHAVT